MSFIISISHGGGLQVMFRSSIVLCTPSSFAGDTLESHVFFHLHATNHYLWKTHSTVSKMRYWRTTKKFTRVELHRISEVQTCIVRTDTSWIAEYMYVCIKDSPSGCLPQISGVSQVERGNTGVPMYLSVARFTCFDLFRMVRPQNTQHTHTNNKKPSRSCHQTNTLKHGHC